MSRRDTIIVAVLINAGLLIVLFASALKSQGPEQELAALSQRTMQEIAEMPKKHEPAPVLGGDEVDKALSSYTPASVKPEIPVAQAPSTPAPSASFADDLQFITLPEPQAPVLAAVEVDKGSSEYSDHKVKKGDVLEKIARHHHCTVDQIMKLNKLTSSNLRIGQVLKIPASAAAKTQPIQTTTIAQAPAANDSSAKYYTVKNGDNPWTIAVKNHMKVEDLLKLNHLDDEKARRLKPGDQLRIR